MSRRRRRTPGPRTPPQPRRRAWIQAQTHTDAAYWRQQAAYLRGRSIALLCDLFTLDEPDATTDRAGVRRFT
jgi:hypothetical protein